MDHTNRGKHSLSGAEVCRYEGAKFALMVKSEICRRLFSAGLPPVFSMDRVIDTVSEASKACIRESFRFGGRAVNGVFAVSTFALAGELAPPSHAGLPLHSFSFTCVLRIMVLRDGTVFEAGEGDWLRR
jgi:hypothetical protein